MPRFEPFHALRYAATGADDRGGSDPQLPPLDQLVAPPYDVVSEAEIAQLNGRSEYNISRVDNPRGGPDRYDRAGAELQKWRDAGVVRADPVPTFTIYRLRFTDAAGQQRDVAGVLGGLEVVDEGAGGVLPHERTTPKASTDRLDLTRATAANLSPIWGLSLAPGLTELLSEPGEVVGTVVDGGVEHVVERIDDPDRITAIAELLSGHDVLIADGHHRYGISRTYRDEQRAADPDAETRTAIDGGAELTLTFVNELIADQLSVEAIHRVYTGVPFDELRSALAAHFELTPTDEPGPQTLAAMAQDGFLVLVGPDGAERLEPKPGAFADVRALDGAWLETALAGLFEGGAAEVSYQHGLDEAVAAVAGGASAAVLIRPVSVAEIERTAREGLLMPPKSTFFTPKLKTGLVLRAMSS